MPRGGGFEFGAISISPPPMKRRALRLHFGPDASSSNGSRRIDLGVVPDGASNEFDDVTVPEDGAPGADAGPPAPEAGPATKNGSATGCACCVSSVSIGNVTTIDNATHMGHSFDAVIDMTYPVVLRSPGSGHCTLQWFERTNVPAFPGVQPNVWTDMFALMPTSPTFNPWHNRTETCGGRWPVTITDPPSLGKRPGRTVTRTLDFNIVVSSSSSGCRNVSKNATATQVLAMVNGAADWPNSSFT